MTSVMDVFTWLIESGRMKQIPTLQLYSDPNGNKHLHSNPSCCIKDNYTNEVTLTLDELYAHESYACLDCLFWSIGGRHSSQSKKAEAAMRALRRLVLSRDLRNVFGAASLPALVSERVHQLIDQTRVDLQLGTFGSVGEVIADGIDSTLKSLSVKYPRASKEVLLIESTRLAAVVNTTMGSSGYANVINALLAGREPSQALACIKSKWRSRGAEAIIKRVASRITTSNTVFVLVKNYPTTFYRPLSTLLEVAVVASTHFRYERRSIGEAPSELCSTLIGTGSSPNAVVYLERVKTPWRTIDTDAFQTALVLYEQAERNGIPYSASDALETAITLVSA